MQQDVKLVYVTCQAVHAYSRPNGQVHAESAGSALPASVVAFVYPTISCCNIAQTSRPAAACCVRGLFDLWYLAIALSYSAFEARYTLNYRSSWTSIACRGG
jgi:hypothetical protein